MAEDEIDFNISIAIPQTDLVRNGSSSKWTVYKIEVTAQSCRTYRSSRWQVSRRYNDFFTLHQELKKDFPKALGLVSFPPKRLFGRFNEAFVEERRRALEKYLEIVMENPDIINSCAALRIFMEIDKNLSELMRQEKTWVQSLNPSLEQSAIDCAQKLQYARALYKFEARNEEELGLNVGDIVIVTDLCDNNGWWFGKFHGNEGFFPINYVQLLDDIPAGYEMPDVNQSTPAIPNPVVPNRLSMKVQEKRRTRLLETLQRKQLSEALRDSIINIKESPGFPTSGTSRASQEEIQNVMTHPPPTTPAPEPPTRKKTEPSPVESEFLNSIKGTALYDFVGEKDNELSFKKGDTVEILSIDHYTGWWQGIVNNTLGYLPGSYIALPKGGEEKIPIVEPFQDVEEELSQSRIVLEEDKKPLNKHKDLRLSSIGIRVVSVGPIGPEILKHIPSANEVPQDVASKGEKKNCILCVCEDWIPLADEPLLCQCCRHLKKMHREPARH